MIDPGRIYHIGIVVPDLARAMDDLTRAMGYSWTSVRSADFNLLVPGGRATGRVKFVFTRQGPPWLEFIEGPNDSIWSAAGGSSMHHLGFYVDDLEAESRRLESLGMAFEIGNQDAEGRLRGFAYHRNPHGGRIELVAESAREGLERWINEGV